jgi:UDP-N-acetylmuramoyl-L-alanyl-D-glutamate--2,6-diaminopimelate ligase
LTPRGIRLSTLLEGAGVQVLGDTGADPVIRGVTLDSRRVGPGDIFFAVQGYKVDGLRFVPDAVGRGARAIVSSSPRPAGIDPGVAWVRVAEPRRAAGLISRECHGRPDQSLTLVGITGTNGKTTVAHLVEAIAEAAGRRAGRIGTVGYAFAGIERAAVRTTPEAPDLYRLLAEMRDESIDLVAMEVSSHALALHRVEGARFATAAFLNLSREHLDFHPDEEEYFSTKARLFESLTRRECAVLPADLPHGKRIAEMTDARVLTFGRAQGADVRLREEHCGLEGSSAVLDTPDGPLPVRTFLLGRFNLSNVAAAAACALAVDLPPESISTGILAVQSVPGRVEPVDHGQPFTVLVDYAHTEEALGSLLSWVRELTPGGIRLVFGCGGDRDRGKRADMGRVAARLADSLFLTSDNPRGENPQAILGEIERGVASAMDGARDSRSIIDRREAIHAAIEAAEPGDVVLIVGKGHESTQVFADRIEPFDDRLVAARALESLGWRGGKEHAGA